MHCALATTKIYEETALEKIFKNRRKDDQPTVHPNGTREETMDSLLTYLGLGDATRRTNGSRVR
eukprot:jgi/Psemu1/303498/fgenesh1_kg.108_\